jgi:hypothetical protein
MGYWMWVLGTAMLIVVRTIAVIAVETTHRRTKTALMREARAGTCTIDRRGGNLFFAGTLAGVRDSGEQPRPEGG